MTRQWYRYLFNLFNLTNEGSSPVSIDDLALAPVAQPSMGANLNGATGTLGTTNGGTGLAATPTNGQLLIGNGTGFSLNTLTAGTGVTLTNGAGTITVAASAAASAVNLTGGATGSLPYQSGVSTTTFLPIGTASQVLQVNAGATAPEWTTLSSGTVTSVAALTLGTAGTDLSSTVATPTTTPVITLNVPTASAANRGALSSTDWTTFNGKQAALVSGTNIKTVNSASLLGSGNVAVGTVTSVGFTGGVVSVATPTTTPAFTVAGTSGGIPYFSSATTWATSAVLAANALVVGGGAAVAPSTVATGTNVLTALGVNVGTAGSVVVNGGVLGTPSSGTVTNLTGTASININGTVGATTRSTGAFTTLTANSNSTFTGGHGTNAFGAVEAAALLALSSNATGATDVRAVHATQEIQTAVTGFYDSFRSSPTLAASTTLSNLRHFAANSLTLGAGATISTQAGFNVGAGLTAATTNYGFFGNLAAATGRWNYYAAGTANNAYAGNSRFGGVTVPVATVDVTGSVAATTTILSTGATSGVGYATGAGGSQTQLTSRTTGVTLNTICGRITLFSTTTTAGTFASFTVTNSAVAATDVVIINIGASATADRYNVTVTAVAAGSFRVQIHNVAAVGVAEAPVLNFAIIKAVTA
jgi:hypothetical protein